MLELLDEFKVFTEVNAKILDNIITNKTLSSGQMQKISFIRAFLSGCDILFLDESTSNLDIGTKKQISDILNTKNITIINSTHNAKILILMTISKSLLMKMTKDLLYQLIFNEI